MRENTDQNNSENGHFLRSDQPQNSLFPLIEAETQRFDFLQDIHGCLVIKRDTSSKILIKYICVFIFRILNIVGCLTNLSHLRHATLLTINFLFMDDVSNFIQGSWCKQSNFNKSLRSSIGYEV